MITLNDAARTKWILNVIMAAVETNPFTPKTKALRNISSGPRRERGSSKCKIVGIQHPHPRCQT